MLSIGQLEGFYWVARSGGYTEAARRFPYPITQPGVHKQVRRVEGELGVPLFERAGRTGVRLTPAGERLFAFAAPFFEELPAVAAAIAGGELGGRLRIEAPGLVVRHLLPPWLKRLRKERPRITVEVREADAPDLGRLRGDADLVVDFLPELPPGVAAREVGAARAFAVLPSPHPLARRSRLALAALTALADEPFVAYTPDLPHARLQAAALAAAGITPRSQAAASSAETIAALVGAGLGFSIIPWLDGRGPSVPGAVAVPLAAPEARFPIAAAFRERGAVRPLVEAALELV